MSEEEKKAIEMIEIIVDECKLENKRKGYEGTYYDGDTPIPYKEYEIVLNLITKLQKENKEKDKQIDLMSEIIYKKLKKYELKKYCNKRNSECKTYYECFKCIKQYFEKLAKEKGE